MPTDEFFDALPESFRKLDKEQGQDFLRRYLERPQYWYDKISEKTEELKSIIDPRKVNPEYLRHKAGQVGIDDELYDVLIKGRSNEDVRRIIMTMMYVWRGLGTENGLVNSIRFFTAHEAQYKSWHESIAVLGQSQIGEGLEAIGDFASPLDEYRSRLKLKDNGRLDEEQLLYIVDLHRAGNEIIEISVLDAFSNCAGGAGTRSEWVVESGGFLLEFEDCVMRVPEGAIIYPVVHTRPSTFFTHALARVKFRVSEHRIELFMRSHPNNLFDAVHGPSILVHVDGHNSYVAPTGDGTYPAQVPVPFPMYPGVWYSLTVLAQPRADGTGTRLDAWIDDNPVLINVSGASYSSGIMAIYNSEAGNILEIDQAEFSRFPGRTATVSRNGFTLSPNFVE